MRLKVAALFVLVMCLSPGRALAQDGRIFGSVVDTEGGVLPGVTLTATNEATGFNQIVVTNERGEYEFRSLPRGPYRVDAELLGFNTITRSNLTVGLDTRLQLDLRLEVGSLEETIVVVGEVPVVESRSAEVAANITETQIQTLPVQGRQWIDLATLLPGTGQDAIRARYYNSVNIGAGVNFYSNGFYVDGVNNNWQQQGEPRQDFPQDSIAEFRVHAFNARSVYGFAQGGVLSTVTKSGTNQVRGSLFEFYRTKALNSRTVFQDEKPDYSRHQLGGSIGGPIVRDRAHFFGSFEYTDESEFFTVNTRGAFPEEEGTFKAPTWVAMGVGRYDHRISLDHRLFSRVGIKRNQKDFVDAGGTRARNTGAAFAAPAWSLVVGETWTISSRSLNDLRFQYAHATYQGWPSDPGLKWTKAGEFPQERVDSLPDIVNRPSLTKGTARSFLGPESRWQVKNDFVRLLGRHELTVGADLNWIRWTPDNMGIGRTWSFATDAPFNANDPSTYPFQFQQRLAPTYDDISSTEYSVYVDDRWQLSSDLTLNIGVRYDLQTGVFNTDLLERTVPEIRIADRVFRQGGRLDPALFPFYDGSTRGDKNNFGPRVGLAWNVGGDGRQVIRAAYGVYYNRYRATGANRAEFHPESFLVIINNPSYPDPYQGRDPFELAAAVRNFTIQGNDNRNPYTHQVSSGYSRQLDPMTAMSVHGTYAFGRNQHTQIDRNYFATQADLAARVRPFPQYGQVTEGRTDGELKYSALELRLERRMSRRWQALGSYTLSSAKNDSETFPANHFAREGDYGYAEADRRHRLTASGIVDAFAGVQLSAILKYQSPQSFNVTAGRDLNGDGINNDRPFGVTRNQGCRGLDLDAVNTYRAANDRAAVSGVQCPSYLALDLQFSRHFNLGGERRLEAIFQVFNVTNRANYFPPVGNALSPLFGQSLQVASPRQMELAVRFRF